MNYTRIHTYLISCLLLMLGLSLPSAMWAGTPSPSTTTLTVSASSVPIRTLVTLTARVTSGGKAVAPGLVTFCSATAKYCQNSAVLGQAQLTHAGTATLHLIFPIGAHSIKAVFQGTNLVAGSHSAAESVDVTGEHGTTTTISATGKPGDYSLTGMVTSLGVPDQTGTVIFPDATNNNRPVAEAQLGAAALGFAFVGATSSGTNPGVVGFNVGVAAADFNGDGRLDQAVFNANGGLSILLGNGDGTFIQLPPLNIACTDKDSCFAMAVGDFNGDDIPDLAVANYSYFDSTVTILLGKGDGTFTAAASLSAPAYSVGVAVGDFNRDGNADLLVGGYGGLQVLLGNGDGSFTPGPATEVAYVDSIAVGDFNGDGKADLALAGSGVGGLAVLLGNGDGTFAQLPPLSFFCHGACFATLVADFNGDGKPDLAVGDSGPIGEGSPGTVYIFLGNGDGIFSPGTSIDDNGNPDSVAVGDFNGDGKADLALGEYGTGPTAVYLGAGDGTFADRLDVSDSASLFASGDFNNDGRTDLVVFPPYQKNLLTTAISEAVVSATVSGVSVHGTGTHYVFAQYQGDETHHQSYSSTAIPLQAR